MTTPMARFLRAEWARRTLLVEQLGTAWIVAALIVVARHRYDGPAYQFLREDVPIPGWPVWWAGLLAVGALLGTIGVWRDLPGLATAGLAVMTVWYFSAAVNLAAAAAGPKLTFHPLIVYSALGLFASTHAWVLRDEASARARTRRRAREFGLSP